MRLEKDILDQLGSIFSGLDVAVMLLVKGSKDDPRTKEMEEFARDFASTSPSLSVKTEDSPT